MNNSFLFGVKDNLDMPRVAQPEKCDKTCIRYNHCDFPASCPVQVKMKRAAKQKNERWVMP